MRLAKLAEPLVKLLPPESAHRLAVNGMKIAPPRDRRARRARARSKPSLLKPNRLMTAASSGRRNRRGRALPSCGRGVSVPTSTKPKPSLSIAPGTSAFLSNPAARPSGFGTFSPRAATASRGLRGLAAAGGAMFMPLMAKR